MNAIALKRTTNTTIYAKKVGIRNIVDASNATKLTSYVEHDAICGVVALRLFGCDRWPTEIIV